jgi:hypothetical protein
MMMKKKTIDQYHNDVGDRHREWGLEEKTHDTREGGGGLLQEGKRYVLVSRGDYCRRLHPGSFAKDRDEPVGRQRLGGVDLHQETRVVLDQT